MAERGPLLLVSTGIPDPEQIAKRLALARREGESVHALAELHEELPAGEGFAGRTRLDDHRPEDLTIRDAADRADRLLRDLRPRVEGRFSQRGGSLWLAQETYTLHFHLLRVLDTLGVVIRALEELRPSRVVCVGPVTMLAKLFVLTAESRGVPVKLEPGGGLRRELARWVWRAQRLLLARPFLYLLPVYAALGLRSFSRRRSATRGEGRRGAAATPGAPDGALRVCFIGSNRKQSDVTIQLCRYLDAQGGFETRFLNLVDEELARLLEEQGLPFSRISDHGGASASRARADARRRFLVDALQVFSSRAFRDRFQAGGVDFWPVTGHYLTRFALSVAPGLAEVVERSVACFEERPADVVVTPAEWDPRSRACVIGAHAAGAASLSLQRGDITDFPGWGEPIFSQRMAVNGPAVERAMVGTGVPPEQIVVTGDSRLDPWVRDARDFFTPGATRAELGIPADRRLVAVMTNPVTLNEKASHAEEYVGGLLELEARDPSLHFVIKLHPNEYDLAFYERIRDRVGARNVTVVKELSTPQLLFDADAVVTTISTTGEEAIFLGKPLVVVNLTNEPDFMPYVGSTAAVTVRDRGQLGEGLFQALDDETVRAGLRRGRADYVAEHFLADDGRSSERCAALIRELAASRSAREGSLSRS